MSQVMSQSHLSMVARSEMEKDKGDFQRFTMSFIFLFSLRWENGIKSRSVYLHFAVKYVNLMFNLIQYNTMLLLFFLTHKYTGQSLAYPRRANRTVNIYTCGVYQASNVGNVIVTRLSRFSPYGAVPAAAAGQQ